MSSLYDRMGKFNETYYLMENRDVHEAVNKGDFVSGEQHFTLYGGKELRNPNALFDIEYYSAQNPDVRAAVTAGEFSSAFEHFVMYGLKEGRIPSAEYADFDEETYLNARGNEDIRVAHDDGDVPSGFWHYVMYGHAEGRGGYRTEDPPPDGPQTTFTLTQRADNITGNNLDNTFLAPVTQNETGSGQLANTFETGDVLNGGGGRNVLRADLIGTGTIQDGDIVAPISAPISATTTNIQEVYLRAQMPNFQNTIDAENMSGVQQWWTVNSRSNIVIEDIRSATVETTFGMRLTDPRVDYTAFFNALFMQGDMDSESALTLRIQDITDGQNPAATELRHISVREINFDHDGVSYTLSSEAMRAADTWAQLQAAIAAELGGHGLDTLSVSHTGNGVFVISDSAGGVFEVQPGEALILGVDSDRDVRNRVDVGRVVEEGPTVTNVILDGVGNGSQGGDLNIAAMSGLRGVEVFDVTVDRDSHLQIMHSVNQAGPVPPWTVLVPNQFLQVVNLESMGANGNLQLGRRSDFLDGRAAMSQDLTNDGLINVNVRSGLYNVREVNGADFQGQLNIAIALDNNTIGRYLDPATEPVNFVYTASANNDIFHIADLSTLGVSDDADFAMQVDMGAGDDRLIIDVGTVRNVSVAGGTGENTIVVSNSHGTTAADTFAGFSGFQTYEVEGNADTDHDFDSMTGIQNVIIATDDLAGAGFNTTLINLAADQNVTISGKNQTIGNDSSSNQLFGIIELRNDAGATRTVTLENTARLSNPAVIATTPKDGVLSVDQLLISQVAGTSATRSLVIESGGARNVANVIEDINAARVNNLTLNGTQDLTAYVSAMANTTRAPLNIDASALTGDMHLGLNGAMLNVITGTGVDTIVGTSGGNDVFMLRGVLTAGNQARVSAFETVQFGSFNDTMFGDLQTGNWTAQGTLNTANISTNHYVMANLVALFRLDNLSSGTVVDLGDVNRDDLNVRVLNQNLDEQINLVSSAANAAGTVAELNINRLDVIGSGTFTNIAVGDQVAGVAANIGGFRTINLDVARDASLAANVGDVNNINLLVGSQARTLNITGGQDGRTNDLGAGADRLDIGTQLHLNLETIDLSDYNGRVALTMQQNVPGAQNQTDVTFVMSGYSANITLSNGTGAVPIVGPAENVTHNSVFQFTAAGTTAVPSVWIIDNIVASELGTADINNTTLFDLRDLGIANYAQVARIDVGTSLDGTIALGANTIAIRSEAQGNAGIETWEIIVTGVENIGGAANIGADNFIF